jgi:opacity protein-like surface antigen
MTPCLARCNLFVAVVLAVLGAARNDAHAQAWVSERGTLDVSLDYNFAHSDKVVGDKDIEFPHGGTTTNQFTLGAEYVPIDKLAVSVGLPLALLAYNGQLGLYPHLGGGSYDDGNTHATLTDLRANVRYQLLEEPFVFTPQIGGSIPVADYETVGNTVAGRHLKALHMGAAIGRVFGASTYVHLAYDFGLTEHYDRTADTGKQGQNTSDLSLTIGHKLLDQRLDIHIDGNLHLTHGGINFSEFSTLPSDDQLYHDPILREDLFLAGGGVGYQLSDALTVNLSGRYFVTGINTQNASVVALGLIWTALSPSP